MGFRIRGSRLAPRSGEKVVARRNNFETGRNGNFDLVLIERASGHFDLEVFMKLQFFFIDGDDDKSGWATKSEHEWTANQKAIFLVTWYSTIKYLWSKRKIAKLSNGKFLSVFMSFYIQEAGTLSDHFEIDVVKIPASGVHSGSYVDTSIFSADVVLDSKDFTPKASGQRAAIHEFGHMLGLPDEYKTSSAHYSDKTSIMNTGTVIKPRHFSHLTSWVEKRIR